MREMEREREIISRTLSAFREKEKENEKVWTGVSVQGARRRGNDGGGSNYTPRTRRRSRSLPEYGEGRK